jgi:antirestriction protein ArdC
MKQLHRFVTILPPTSRQPLERASPQQALRRVLKADKRAFFTACSQASKAADYLRGLALAEPVEVAA